MSVFTFRLSKLASRHKLRSHSHRVLSGLKGGINWCAFPSSFKFTFRVRGFHLGFQTQENWWKHEAAGRVFFIVFDCLETLMKPDARVLKKSLLNRASGIKENGNIHEFFTCCQSITCLSFKLRNEFNTVWCFLTLIIKLMDSASLQCFTRVSDNMHVTKLACLGWMITLWIINEFEKSGVSDLDAINLVNCQHCS